MANAAERLCEKGSLCLGARELSIILGKACGQHKICVYWKSAWEKRNR